MARAQWACSVLQSYYKSHLWPLSHSWRAIHTRLPSMQASCLVSLLPRGMRGKDRKALIPSEMSSFGEGCRDRRLRGQGLAGSSGACDELLDEGSETSPTCQKQLLPRASQWLSVSCSRQLRPSFRLQCQRSRCQSVKDWNSCP